MRAFVRLISGGALLAGVFWAQSLLEHHGSVGLLNLSALLLVLVGPYGVALVAYELPELLSFAMTVWRALSESERASGVAFDAAMAGIVSHLKAGKPAEAAALAESTPSSEARTLGLLLLKKYDRGAAQEALLSQGHSEIARLRRAEDFFLTMARAAPAFGLIGTILGFIDLLGHLQDASKLGPGMALALTATLYGIASSYCLYHPLAKAVGAFAKKRAAAWKTAETALLMAHDGRSARDIQHTLGTAA